MNMFARFDENPAMTLQDIKETKLYGQILNMGPVYTGPLIRGQVSKITGQISSESAN